jgi:F0F1-type ATP synthase assembly protein I
VALLRPRSTRSQTARAWEAAFQAALSIGVGVVLGYYVDRWLGTEPVFLFVFMAAGLVACVRTLLRIQTPGASDRERTEDRPPGEGRG